VQPYAGRVPRTTTDACQVSVACVSQTEANRIAGHLVEQRLAACAQVVGPVTSTYRWQGAVETAAEWLCLVKTRQAIVDDVIAAVRSVHSYDTPEIIATPIVAGDADYLAWIDAETS
jgi:periplasmic divalent cation tolerance protein